MTAPYLPEVGEEGEMNKWEFAEVVLNTPSEGASLLTLGLQKGSAIAIIYGEPKGPGKIAVGEIHIAIAEMGLNGWDLIGSTESFQPNGWLTTRWLFKRPKK
ncbi:MAG: hypothetical protein HY260_11850 [Chloroflexi bacterium]|nr:hypothetical protein [Chloroflexota bacterium]